VYLWNSQSLSSLDGQDSDDAAAADADDDAASVNHSRLTGVVQVLISTFCQSYLVVLPLSAMLERYKLNVQQYTEVWVSAETQVIRSVDQKLAAVVASVN